MGDDDDGAARGAQGIHCLSYGGFAFGIEVGGRLVQHDQWRAPIEGACQADPLPLASERLKAPGPISVS